MSRSTPGCGWQAGAHLVGEDAVAQLLGLEDLGLAGGEADVQVAGLARGAVLARLDVLEHGLSSVLFWVGPFSKPGVATR
jgi:hypothetical protein